MRKKVVIQNIGKVYSYKFDSVQGWRQVNEEENPGDWQKGTYRVYILDRMQKGFNISDGLIYY